MAINEQNTWQCCFLHLKGHQVPLVGVVRTWMGSVGPNKMIPSLGIPRIGCLHASVGVKQSHSGSKISILPF